MIQVAFARTEEEADNFLLHIVKYDVDDTMPTIYLGKSSVPESLSRHSLKRSRHQVR